MKPDAYDAGDAGQVQKAKKDAKFSRDTELSELRAILKTDGGRKFLWRVLGKCGVYQTSFTGNSETFYNEGRRAVGLWLLGEIQAADKRGYLSMMDEALTKEQSA